MSEPVPGRIEVQSPEALRARVAALRSDGAESVDPVRFRVLETLSARIAGQPEAVRHVLQGKLQVRLDEYVQCVARARQDGEAGVAPIAVRAAEPTLLAQLNRSIVAARAAIQSDGHADGPEDELPSVARFRRAWTSLRIHDQVEEAVARKPANGGPLNSHVLVLQTLDLLRDLSPRYLERFMAHVQTLQWLEQAGQRAPGLQGNAVKTVRRKK